MGISLGCVSSKRCEAFTAKMTTLDAAREQLSALTITPSAAKREGIALNQDGQRRSALDLIAHPQAGRGEVMRLWPELAAIPSAVLDQLEADSLYSGYLDRQTADIAAFRRDESLGLPDDLDYAAVAGLSTEAAQKLARIRPTTLGQASRIEGITPAALTALLLRIKIRDRQVA
jgi:tRNA uridine 5-carboxymethylaminomethyl modification enzyme